MINKKRKLYKYAVKPANWIEYTEGEKIGECFYIRDDGKIKSGSNMLRSAIFKCICGKEFRSPIIWVKSLKTSSCGCGIIKKAKLVKNPDIMINGKKRSEYIIWELMKKRCFNKNSKAFKNYGGRGITMCDQWEKSFSSFLKDVGPRPSMRHSIDRFPDNNGNYEPNNVRWATDIEQGRNKRSNVMITFEGISLCASEWGEKLGIPGKRVLERFRSGLPIDKVLFIGNLPQPKKKVPIRLSGL